MKRSLDLLWLDAHADIHTLISSESHNIHGMPVAGLLGLNEGARILANLGDVSPKLDPSRLMYFGLRDVDNAEDSLMRRLNIPRHYSSAILSGAVNVYEETRRHLIRNLTGFSLFSADLDGLDPADAPGVTTNVSDGLRMEHYIKILKALHDHRGREKVMTYEIDEFNPGRFNPSTGMPLLTPPEQDQTVLSMVLLLEYIVSDKPRSSDYLARQLQASQSAHRRLPLGRHGGNPRTSLTNHSLTRGR